MFSRSTISMTSVSVFTEIINEGRSICPASLSALSAALKIKSASNVQLVSACHPDHSKVGVATLSSLNNSIKNHKMSRKPILFTHDQFRTNSLEFFSPPSVISTGLIEHFSNWSDVATNTLLVAANTSSARESLPWFCARAESGLDIGGRVNFASDVVEISDYNEFARYTYAGNALTMCSFKVDSPLSVLTVRQTAFSPFEYMQESSGDNNVDIISLAETKSETFWKDVTQANVGDKDTDSLPSLSSAKCVISGGRALKSGENFEEILRPLCRKLKGAMGASRAAVDAGYVANELQVGQTGKVVAPNLYFAIGISGAIQHVAGMKDSKVIVAINKDADAPIFQLADYGIVGDLFKVVPELTDKL